MKRVFLVTAGCFSESALVAEGELKAYLRSLPETERKLALVTEFHGLDADDLEFIERTKSILKRIENEKREIELNLEHRLKSRKRA